MAKKEVKTDLWVARQLDDSKIKYDAQGSDVKEINDALQSHQSVVLATPDTLSMLQLLKILLLSSRTKPILQGIRS